MDLTTRFVELVEGPESDLVESLDEAALLIAAHARPDLDIEAYRGRLDDLAAGCAAPTLDALTHQLFRVEGFGGNDDDYYDPRNSYLDQVLDRRLGIPISLAVVILEVGRRLGLEMAGVGMPGHFLVRLRSDPPVIVDPFGGKILTWADCEARFRSVEGDDTPFAATWLAPIGPRALLARMLANLKQVHATKGDGRSLEWVLRLRSAIPGVGTQERLNLADVLAARGRWAEAASTLDSLAPASGDEGAGRLRARASLLRARLN